MADEKEIAVVVGVLRDGSKVTINDPRFNREDRRDQQKLLKRLARTNRIESIEIQHVKED